MTLSLSQLNLYLKKINVSTPIRCDLHTLFTVVEGHAFTFPFETINLHDSTLDNKPSLRASLDIKDLFNKLVLQGQGGRCVELNFFLQTVLKTIGFNVIPLLGSDLYLSAHLPKRLRPKHSAAIVKIDQSCYLVDSAFGDLGLISPIPLQAGTTQQYSETFRLIPGDDDAFELHTHKNEKWIRLFGFDLNPACFEEYLQLNNVNANVLNQQSKFKTLFLCTKPFKLTSNTNGRKTIFNDVFSIWHHQKRVFIQEIDSQKELHYLLAQHFGIQVEGRYLRHTQEAMLAFMQEENKTLF